MFVEPTNLAYFRHFGHRVPNYNERIFLPWFRPGLCPKPTRVFASWNMVVMFCKWWLSSSDTLVHLISCCLDTTFLRSNGLPSFQHLAMFVVENGNVSLGMVSVTSCTQPNSGRQPQPFLSLVQVLLLLLRWGCREHFVSGCWHSSGRDRGRYPRECWLSTLGVLHPGVPVMWYAHIRDLSPTAEAVRRAGRPM